MPSLQSYFQNLSIGRKFSMLGTLAFALIAILAWQGLSTTLALRASTVNEIRGVQELDKLANLIEGIQAYRAQQVGHGQAAKSDSIDEGFKKLGAALPSEWTKAAELHSQNSAAWTEIKNQIAGLKPGEASDKLSGLMDNMLREYRLVSDESELTLDPVLSTYYLMSVSNFDLPAMQESLSDIQVLTSLASSSSVDSGYALGLIKARAGAVSQIMGSVKLSHQNVHDSLPPDYPHLAELSGLERELQTQSGRLRSALDQQTGDQPPALSAIATASGELQLTVQKLAHVGDALLLTLLEERSAAHSQTVMWSVVAMIVLSALAMGLGLMVVRDLRSRVKSTLGAIQKLAAGDLQAVNLVASEDEVGLISAQLEALRKSQTQFAQDLNNTAMNLAESVEVLTSTSLNVKQGALRQSDSSSSVAASIEEMTAAIAHISDNTQVTQEIACNVGERASQGRSGIERVCENMGQIKVSSDELQELISELGQSSQAISGIVDTIGAIAKQTNLLALNAAIEAARAGEEGRGFAVVADEVRGLAEKTAVSTREIALLIRRVQDKASGAVSLVTGWNTVLESGMDEANATLGTMTVIERESAEAQGSVMHMKESVAEQSDASHLIAQQVEVIARMAEDNESAMSRLDDMIQQIKGLSLSMKTQAQRFHW